MEIGGHVVQEEFFSLMGAMSVRLGGRFPLAHSTSILGAQITPQSVGH